MARLYIEIEPRPRRKMRAVFCFLGGREQGIGNMEGRTAWVRITVVQFYRVQQKIRNIMDLWKKVVVLCFEFSPHRFTKI